MQNKITLFSPAKINLYLNILRKRTDGYHELETVMQALSFGDKITLTFNNSQTIKIKCNDKSVPTDNTNIIWEIIEKFHKESLIIFNGISIKINKKIPVGSGLGGGSSNGITVLNGLNNYYNKPLSHNKLINIAKSAGSDTVFFLSPETWLLKGRGEKRERALISKKWNYLLIFPPFPCITQKVYANFKLHLTKKSLNNNLNSLKLDKVSLQEIEAKITNNLTDCICETYPQMKKLIERIEKETSKKVFISGSGSTLFMIFEDRSQANQIKKMLQMKLNSNMNFILSKTL